MSGSNKRGIRAKAGAWILILTIVIGLCGIRGINAEPVFANTWDMTVKSVGAKSAKQGDKNVNVVIEIVNNEDKELIFDSATLEYTPSDDIRVSGGLGATTTLESGGKMQIAFTLDVEGYAETGMRDTVFTIKQGEEIILASYVDGRITIYEDMPIPKDYTGVYVPALDITKRISPAEGFEIGNDNKIAFELANNGNTVIKNTVVSITLPDGITVYNDSNTESLGSFSVGIKRTASFPITVDKGVASKNYPVTVKITGVDYSNKSVAIEQTFYIPVLGTGAYSLSDVAVSNISMPQQGVAGEDFTLSFDVENSGSVAAEDLVISAEPPEGVVNKTKNMFAESSIAEGERRSYSVTFFTSGTADEKSYPIKIVVKSSKGGDNADSVMQYAGIFLKKINGNTKTPQIMVDQYQYGGSYVQAGSNFRLNLGLYNTSKKKLSNIKVTLNADEGTFVPVGSSNSFFIESMEAKEHLSDSVMFNVKPAAEQKTVPIEVSMTYEDGAGNEFTAKDTVSVPVVQQMRLKVDEIMPPVELYAGMPASASVQFYNMGKGALNNLTVNVTGDFDTMEATNYFAGNVETGKSDTYDFNFTPRHEGPLEGEVVFTYEDASGQQQTFSSPFEFQVMAEMPAVDDGSSTGEDQNNNKKYKPWLIGGGISAAAVIVALILWKKHRKKKLDRELEIDE